MSAPEVTIVSTGEELVCGDTLDTNAHFLAGELTAHGLRVRRMIVLGDDSDLLATELRRAACEGGFIVLSGGLGPTADDRTRKAIASAAGEKLVVDPQSLEHVRGIIEAFGHAMTEAHAVQACFPEGSEVFANPCGTARGFACRVGEATLLAMPGVPREMRAVFREGVLPWLLAHSSGAIVVRKVNLFGLPESRVDAELTDLLTQGRNPSVGLKVDEGAVSVCLRGRADSRQEGERLVERDVQVVRERFGEAAFGCDEVTLAQSLAQLLERHALTVAIAESCTGGLVGSLLTDVPGISRHFLVDVVAYSNESKVAQLGVPAEEISEFGAVSPQVAQSLARGVCEGCGAALGISTTGIAGPTGGTQEKPVGLVYVGLCLDGRTWAHKLNLRGDRLRVKDRAAKHALNFARLALLRRGREA